MKTLRRRIANHLLAKLARMLPGATSVRPALHRLRGVKIGKDVFIGEDCFLENEFPELIEIGDHTALAPRVMVVCHVGRTDQKEGVLSGRVVIGQNVFIGVAAILAVSPKSVLTIGDGAVIGAGTVIVNRPVARQTLVAPAPYHEIARALIPFPVARSYEQFVNGLRPYREPRIKLSKESR